MPEFDNHTPQFVPSRWIGRDGMPIDDEDALEALQTLLSQAREASQLMLDEAVQMGCSEHFVRIVLSDMIDGLDKPGSVVATTPE